MNHNRTAFTVAPQEKAEPINPSASSLTLAKLMVTYDLLWQSPDAPTLSGYPFVPESVSHRIR